MTAIDVMEMDATLIVVLSRYSIVNWNRFYVIDMIVMVSMMLTFLYVVCIYIYNYTYVSYVNGRKLNKPSSGTLVGALIRLFLIL